MKYHILTDDRKTVKAKLEELAGKKADYAGAPTFSYTLEGITIGRDGTVTATEEADDSLISGLIESGLLEAEAEVTETEEVDTSAQDAQEAPVAEENEQVGETADRAEEATETETVEPQSEAEVVEDEIQPPADESEYNDQDTEFSDTAVSFPLSQHRPDSIANLIFTIYSKGDLLTKSTGGDFFVSDALEGKLKGAAFRTNEDVLRHLKDASREDLRGLSFTDEKVAFDGFPQTGDPELIKAWVKLSEAINKAAITQKRVLPKRNEETNEKFAFRTWLTRLGMNGPDLKAERVIYYRNLTGHTAFRTAADAEKWKKRQAERKAEQRAAKSGETAQADTPEETTDQVAEA